MGVFYLAIVNALEIAVIAPRASYSFSTAKKSNQKKPPLQLRPCKETQGFPLRQHSYHAVKKLAENAQTVFTESP